MVQLSWETALVTGASRGIGRGIALKLAESGVQRIAVNYLENDAAAHDVVSALEERGAEAMLVKADVGDMDAVREMFEAVKSSFGTLDIFVHNARPSPAAFFQPPLEITEGSLQVAFDTQAKAMAVATQACVPLMPNGGRIIAITYAPGSITGSWQPWIAMGGAKAALESTVRYFGVALSKQKITVNSVSPGATDDSVFNTLPEAVYQAIKAWNESGWTPAGRMGTPSDVGGVVALLCTEEAAWINGQTIYADGGGSLMNSDYPLDIQGVG